MSQENNNTAKLENNSHNEIISLQDKDNKNLKTSFKSLNLSNQSQDTDLVKIEEKLENVYNEYLYQLRYQTEFENNHKGPLDYI